MDKEAFRRSLAGNAPPKDLSVALQALWHEGKGDWAAAHRMAQGDKSEAGAWVHAYLHRIEGDHGNAGYWYRRAGKAPATGSLKREWEEIATALCEA